MADAGVRIKGDSLVDLVRELKGPAFKDVNLALREKAGAIAADMLPLIADAVRDSAAPQAPAMAETLRVVRDRIPVVAMGRVNPKFRSHKFGHKGETAAKRRRRRGAMSLGVIKGPAGDVNYYQVPVSSSWGPLGAALRRGILREAELRYRLDFIQVLKGRGFDAAARRR